MFDPSKEPLYVPTLKELQALVVPPIETAADEDVLPASASCFLPEATKTKHYEKSSEPFSPRLSLQAEAFLRHAVLPGHETFNLESRWEALGIKSGSIKERILNELHRQGYMRLERKGKVQIPHLYAKTWEYLGCKPFTGEGVGGTTHRTIIKQVARLFAKRGYTVRVEQEIGEHRKRVDLVCYGKHRILGIEVGLSDPRQEIKNLRDDLETGILDLVLFVTIEPDMLAKVRNMAVKDVFISRELKRIKFLIFDEEELKR